MSWNPVLDFVSEVKQRFLEVYRDYVDTMEVEYDENYAYDVPDMYDNVIEYWVDVVDMQEYRDIMQYIKVTQYNNFVLLRYIDGKKPDDFWYRYDGFYRECKTVVIDYIKLAMVCCGMKVKRYNL